MEEKRKGQHPEGERKQPEADVYLRAAPRPQPPGDAEKREIADARTTAEADRDAMRASGHGDHKGEEGF